MSVWINPTFKQTVPNLLSKYLSRDDFLELPHINHFKINDTENILGMKEYNTWHDFLVDEPPLNNNLYDNYPYESDEAVFTALSGYDKIESGLEGVYRIISSLNKGYLNFKDQLPWVNIREQVKACAKVVGPSTQINPQAWIEWFNDDGHYTDKIKWENNAEAFKNMQLRLKSKIPFKTASTQDELYDFDETDIIKSSVWKILAKNDLFIFCGREFMSSVAVVLSLEDMQKIYKTSYCISKSIEYGDYYCNEAVFSGNPFRETLDHILHTLDTVKGEDVHSIARAYHSAYSVALAKLPGNLVPNQLDMLMDDFREDGLNQILDIDQYLRITSQYSVRTKLECLKIYKFLPAPDFDICEALSSIYKHHSKPHPIGEDAVIGGDKIFDMFKKMVRRNYIGLFFSKNKCNPGALKNGIERKTWHDPYINNKKVIVPLDDVFEIDLTASSKFDYVHDQYYTLLEDKVLAPTDFKYLAKPDRLSKSPFEDRSTLLHLLKTPYLYDTEELAKGAKDGLHNDQNHIQIAWKAESHKPSSRVFYMAPIIPRLLIQECERNVRKLLKGKIANYMGISPVPKEKNMSKVCNAKLPVDDKHLESKPLVISFDLSKFSTKFSPEMKNYMNSFFDEIFGETIFSTMQSFVTGSKIAMSKEHMAAYYTNPGVDLEGFTGAQNTWLHIDLMSTAIRVATEENLCESPAQLGVFIDDGIAKIDTTVGKEVELIKCIEKTYAACGFKMGLAKTYVSRNLATFLNEVYYKGIKITPGIKSFLRISPDYQNPVGSLRDESAEIFSKTQGAIKAGTPWPLAYREYLWEMVKTIYRWTKRGLNLTGMSTELIAIWAFTPVSLGGLSFAPLQTLVTTLGSSQLVDGIAVIRLCALTYSSTKQYITKILTQDLIRPTPSSFMREPTRVRRADIVLRESQSGTFILNKLKEITINEHIKFALEARFREQTNTVAKQILDNGVLNRIIINKIWEIMPECFLENLINKFKRAASIIRLLGYRTVGTIRRRNITNVDELISSWISF